MKRFCFFALAISLFLIGRADINDEFTEVVDESQVVEEQVDPEENSNSDEENSSATTVIPEFDKSNPFNLEGLKTYKNWLGEECLDFGTSHSMYFNWKRDVTYVGVPLFLSSFIIKKQKRAFRSARFSMDENWKSQFDNYTQFGPYAIILGLKACGYEGRSSWDRLVTSTLLSNAVMAIVVNSTKYSVKEMRPDNSSANSFPSGHTATAFAAATVLHKEYGLTRSPWFSVAGYGVAMGTGFMRVLNNRHWISDVIAGAGLGILSTEMGYFIGDLIYRNRGIRRLEMTNITNPNHPSFFDIQMGVGIHKKHLTGAYDSGEEFDYELGTSTMVGVEGAYFFNKYIGVGGMARVTTTPTKGLSLTSEERQGFNDLNDLMILLDLPGVYDINMSNNNFIDASFDAGIYGNIPLSKHFSIGAKALIGTRLNGGFEFKARTGYKTQAKDAQGNPIFTGSVNADGKLTNWNEVYVFENSDGSLFNSNETLMPGVSTNYNFYLDPTRFRSKEYTLSKLTGGFSLNYVVGLSATYRYKENFSWKIFIDYDSAKSRYNYSFDLFDEETMKYYENKMDQMDQYPPEIRDKFMSDLKKYGTDRDSFKARLNLFTIGGAFTINF